MKKSGSVQANRLHDIVDHMLKPHLPKAAVNQSFFINDIPAHLYLGANSPVIISVMEGLFGFIVSSARSSCIRLSASLHSNIILLRIRNAGSYSGSLASHLQVLQTLANRGGGYVAYSSREDAITSITLGFPERAPVSEN